MKSTGVFAVLLWAAGVSAFAVPGVRAQGPFGAAAASAGGRERGEAAEPAPSRPRAANCDKFASAQAISGKAGSATFSNVGYGKETGEPEHSSEGNPGGASAWAKWTAPGTGDWTFRLSGFDRDGYLLDTQLSVYTGQSLGTLGAVAANDDTGGGYSSRVSFRATKGTVYRIAMDTFMGAGGTLTLEWNQGRVDSAAFLQYGQFMPREGGALAVEVSSTTNWVVSDASGWISLTTRSGKDRTAMACKVGANGSATNREGTVTVAPVTTGGAENGTLVVYQSCLSFFTNRAAAAARAEAEGKRVLLLNGRETCFNTFTTLMDDLPSADVRSRLEAGYVLWYNNCDRQWEESESYLDGLTSYTLPLLCVIPATNTESFLKRTTGYQGSANLAALLGNVVVFDANGGTPMEKVRHLDAGAALGALPGAERKGFALAGWWTAREGGSRATAATVPGAGVTVYHAHWIDLRQQVAFKGNGGTTAAETGAYFMGEAYGNLPAASWAGHAFLGWFTQASGGTRVTARSIVSDEKNLALYAHWELAEEPLKVWRFYSQKYKGHFFTIGEAEKTQLLTTSLTWSFEGGAYRAYKAKAPGTVPLYRFYSEKYKGHFFTRSEAEKDGLVGTSKTWKYQGIAFYVYPNAVEGSIPVYRFWSDSYGHHFYTANDAEKDGLVATSKTWKYQGIAFWAMPLATATVTFDAVGGTCGTATGTYAPGKPYGALPEASWAGHAFLGWFTEETGGTRVTMQSIVEGAQDRTLYAHWEAAAEPLKVWRFYSEKNKGHFFTIGEAEKTQLLTSSTTWSFQGGAYRAFKTQVPGTVPLYRFYSDSYKGHFFTRSEAEKDSLVATSKTWKFQGIAYYVYPKAVGGSIPVYRFWSESYRHHFYTANESEKDSLVKTSKTWKYQGIAFWALPIGFKPGPQTLTVHDKRAASWSVPVAGYYCDSYQKCEMVYPAAELAAMNGTTITGMTFHATQTNISWGGNCQVFLKEVGGRTIDAFYGPGTVVYEGALRIADNKLVVKFTTPYTYNGGNLLVGVYRTGKGSGGRSSQWVGEQVAGASISGYSSSGLASVTPTQRGFLPKTTFAYELPTAKAAAKAGALRREPKKVRAGTSARGAEDIHLPAERLGAEVTTSDGTDGSAAADGDEGTAWVPEHPESGSWLVLTFDGPIEVAEVSVVGENLPEDTRVLLSEDAETWFEGEGGPAQYVWVAFPPVAEWLKVREVWVAGKGD